MISISTIRSRIKPLVALAGVAGLMAAPANADEVKVVTDIAPVEALVAQVMLGVATPSRLVANNASPHGLALRPSQARDLQEADLIVWIGPELTPWLEKAIGSVGSKATSLVLFDVPSTTVLDPRSQAVFSLEHDDHDDHEKHDDHDDHEKHDDHDDHAKHDDHDDHAKHDDHDDHDKHDDHDDHAKHDDHDDHAKHDDHDEHAKHDDHDEHGDEEHHHHHGDTDPHAWLDPQNGKHWLAVIAASLADIDPANADAYRANAAAGSAEIDATISEIETILAPVKDRPFLVYHDAYQYFEASFGLTALGAISNTDAVTPGPARLRAIGDLAAKGGAHCILLSPAESDRYLESIGTVLHPVVGDPLGKGASYGGLLADIAGAIADCPDH